jgi:hypothetical protein
MNKFFKIVAILKMAEFKILPSIFECEDAIKEIEKDGGKEIVKKVLDKLRMGVMPDRDLLDAAILSLSVNK